MKIEKLEVSQHLDTRKLYEEVFSEDEKSFVDYYYQEKTKDNIIYVVREDDDIQAMLHASTPAGSKFWAAVLSTARCWRTATLTRMSILVSPSALASSASPC